MSVRACEATLGAKGARKELEESCQDAPLNQESAGTFEILNFSCIVVKKQMLNSCMHDFDNTIKSCQIKDTRIL